MRHYSTAPDNIRIIDVTNDNCKSNHLVCFSNAPRYCTSPSIQHRWYSYNWTSCVMRIANNKQGMCSRKFNSFILSHNMSDDIRRHDQQRRCKLERIQMNWKLESIFAIILSLWYFIHLCIEQWIWSSRGCRNIGRMCSHTFYLLHLWVSIFLIPVNTFHRRSVDENRSHTILHIMVRHYQNGQSGKCMCVHQFLVVE